MVCIVSIDSYWQIVKNQSSIKSDAIIVGIKKQIVSKYESHTLSLLHKKKQTMHSTFIFYRFITLRYHIIIKQLKLNRKTTKTVTHAPKSDIWLSFLARYPSTAVTNNEHINKLTHLAL